MIRGYRQVDALGLSLCRASTFFSALRGALFSSFTSVVLCTSPFFLVGETRGKKTGRLLLSRLSRTGAASLRLPSTRVPFPSFATTECLSPARLAHPIPRSLQLFFSFFLLLLLLLLLLPSGSWSLPTARIFFPPRTPPRAPITKAFSV